MTTPDDVPRPRRSRASWVLCGALIVGGAVAPGLAAALSPRMAAGLAVCDGFTLTTTSPELSGRLGGWSRGRDAWGRQVRVEETVQAGPGMQLFGGLEVRSLGPDGRDDAGAGDDVVLTADELTAAGALHAGPLVGVMLAAALAWCLAGPFTHAPRASRAREITNAVGLACVPGLLVLGAARIATFGPDPIFGDPLDRLLDARAMPALLVSPLEGVLAAYTTIVLAVAYAWRTARPRT